MAVHRGGLHTAMLVCWIGQGLFIYECVNTTCVCVVYGAWYVYLSMAERIYSHALQVSVTFPFLLPYTVLGNPLRAICDLGLMIVTPFERAAA